MAVFEISSGAVVPVVHDGAEEMTLPESMSLFK